MPSKEQYAKHRERCLEQSKKWREDNKEYFREQQKEYYQVNKNHRKDYYEQNKEKVKKYYQTDQGKKSQIINNWKRNGLICEDYDKLYEHYLNTNECDNCGIELVRGKRVSNSKCMDHNHKTGLFRNILCHSCNTIRPVYESD